MPYVRDFLSRFRPAGSPGAGRAAMPADRRWELESELGPVLMLLDGPSAECTEIIRAAQQDAEQIVRAAHRAAGTIVSAGRQRAAASVAELVLQSVLAARAEAEAIVAEGSAEAAAIRERTRQRLGALVDRAVILVRDIADSGGAS